jgi:hypothetical protein
MAHLIDRAEFWRDVCAERLRKRHARENSAPYFVNSAKAPFQSSGGGLSL